MRADSGGDRNRREAECCDEVIELGRRCRPAQGLAGSCVELGPVESLRRALQRDVALFGSPAAVRERYKARYLPGQALYQASAAPRDHAHVLIDHELPEAPHVLRWPG
ncbi:hypothetical protein MXD61_08790 [Frankia sp. AgPm24]|nr:hypothetical protein [Frankia sp. AgPm24]MCK9921979.1 hypothetical protein [Frankia sp. AgPm24]